VVARTPTNFDLGSRPLLIEEKVGLSQYSVLNRTAMEADVLLATPRPVPYAVWKRTLDIIASAILLLVLFPVFVIIAIAVKLTSRGPVFYKSDRVGLGGRPIDFVKFRTMCMDADAKLAELVEQNEKDGPIFKIKNDPRTTKVGRILRKFSLDELPQLISVFKGDMSMVGPRPPLKREVALYDERTMQRLTIKPGITCYWQVMGRSDLSFQEWIDLDMRYIEEMSFWVDLKIMLLTPTAVLKGKGAY